MVLGLANKWDTLYRPRTFEQVVGQPEKAHLRAVLRQQGGFPPLLIFRGPSGTGKTTVSRIVAAALNCEELGPKGDPCTKCASCEAIHDGSFNGVYEHNAAFRNGAEDMRELQERAYLQGEGRYSVFILDEAQALSGQAWKVLLKLFEEPPSGTVFILVTSEPTKIPRTIQTRAVTYDFGKVAPDEIKRFVQGVLTAEDSSVIEDLDVIVDLADGSVREAVVLAQQCVRSGMSASERFRGRDESMEVLEALAEGDMAAGLAGIEAMWQKVGSPEYLMDKLSAQVQNAVYRFHRLPLFVSPATAQRLQVVATKLGEKRLSGILGIMAEWQPRIKTKTHLIFMWSEVCRFTNPDKVSVVPKAAPTPSLAVEEPIIDLSTQDVQEALSGLDFT